MMIPQRILPEPELNISSLLESPFDFILILDRDGYILNAGEKNMNRLQLHRDEILGKCACGRHRQEHGRAEESAREKEY